jgi:PHP family Zn ribbon phosphoesterase
MMLFYDLHIHSALSGCGDELMTPNNIANMALLKGLDVIALSDHNCAKNLPAIRKTCDNNGILLIPAIEVCTSEEVHFLCLFRSFEKVVEFGEVIYDLLPNIKNNPEIFGFQNILNENDEIIGEVEKVLSNAVNISIDKLLKILPDYDGVAIPAHVDKSANSIISSLGWIPNEYNFTCIECKNLENSDKIKSTQNYNKNIISNSDAHYLEDILEPIHSIEVAEKTISGVIDALINSSL